MPQFVVTGIEIEKKSIKQFSSFILCQEINDHHTFRLVCPAEAIDDTKGVLFNQSKNMVGSPISIQISAAGGSENLQFFGLVTQVETARFSGHAGDVIFQGHSPTLLMDGGPHCQSWEDKTITDITDDLLKAVPKNLLSPQIEPVYKDKIPYTVQYKETSWQFANRICNDFGEWFYYDGEKLVLGKTGNKKISLTYGRNLSHFNTSLRVKPSGFQLVAYDYIHSETYRGSPDGFAEKAGLNDLGKHALKISEEFYADQPKDWSNQQLTQKKQLDDIITTRACMQSSNMVQVKGTSSHPGVQVGTTISAGGKNVFSLSDESFGEYTVIAVTHHCDGQGNYTNEFTAIPATVKMPPRKDIPKPYCETQSAVVTDNHDKDGLGRVRTKFHWMDSNEKSPWLRITVPHAGEGKGMFFMPEVGEEVIVGFEGDCPTKPYIVGSVYNGKSKCSFGNGGNDVKALQSRSGNKVLLNDKDGSVLIEDAKGSRIMMDGKGNVVIQSSVSITLACGKKGASTISLGQDGSIQVIGKDISIIGSNSIALGSGARDDKGGFDGSGLNFDPQNIAIGAKEKCDIGGGKEFNAFSAIIGIQASGKTSIAGSEVNIN